MKQEFQVFFQNNCNKIFSISENVGAVKSPPKHENVSISKSIRMLERIHTEITEINWVLNIALVFRICCNFPTSRSLLGQLTE